MILFCRFRVSVGSEANFHVCDDELRIGNNDHDEDTLSDKCIRYLGCEDNS